MALLEHCPWQRSHPARPTTPFPGGDLNDQLVPLLHLVPILQSSSCSRRHCGWQWGWFTETTLLLMAFPSPVLLLSHLFSWEQVLNQQHRTLVSDSVLRNPIGNYFHNLKKFTLIRTCLSTNGHNYFSQGNLRTAPIPKDQTNWVSGLNLCFYCMRLRGCLVSETVQC